MPASQREDRTRLDGFELEVFKLVRKGATSRQWREWLRVPLEHAAATGNMDLFSKLMDAGADGSAGYRGCHGRTLLGAAAADENEEMVKTLLRSGAEDDVDVQFGAKQEAALHVSAAHGAEGVSRALMFAGADPNLLDGDEQAPLHLAAREGHGGIVSDLLVKRADPTVETRIGHNTPLHLAAEGGWVLCISTLLLGGADKDAPNYDGKTPLYLAAENNRVGAVEELLAAKADPSIRADNGCRPLDIAAIRNSVDALRTLLRYGGDIKACDGNGYTALHHAAGVDAPAHDNGSSVRVLLEAGADVEAKAIDDECKTPIHKAVGRRILPRGTMSALLEGGADFNAHDSFESTPLHHACDHSNVGGVELLLLWGADETLENEDGEKAEDWVGSWVEDGDDEDEDEERKADDQRIRHMLARAPADRSWRRRGWLVLARSRPNRVQLAKEGCSRHDGSSAIEAQGRCDGVGVDQSGDGDQTMAELRVLVRRVVGLDAEGVFRLVTGFL